MIDPRLKLAWCLGLMATAFLARHAATLALLIGLVLVSDLIIAGSVKKYQMPLIAFAIVASQIFTMQILFNREGVPVWQYGIIKVYSGALPAGIAGTLRAVSLSLPAIQMLTWTSSEDAVLMLTGLGVPYRYAMLVTMAERFLPLLKAEYAAIRESQAVRGVAIDGVIGQLKILPKAMMPFLYRAVRRTSEIALSMELRGFGKSEKRTFMKELHPTAPEIIGAVILLAAFCVSNFYFHI
jgi:energy-coupling factor transport system permease protein